MTPADYAAAIAEKLKAGPTAGPWGVVTDEHPFKTATGGGHHIERRIFTTWVHPQLKSGVGVVNMAVGLGAEGGKPRHFCALSEEDAAYIAACHPAALRSLLDEREALRKDAGRYRWLRDQHWVEPEAVMRLSLSGTDDASKYEREIDAAIDAALKDTK